MIVHLLSFLPFPDPEQIIPDPDRGKSSRFNRIRIPNTDTVVPIEKQHF